MQNIEKEKNIWTNYCVYIQNYRSVYAIFKVRTLKKKLNILVKYFLQLDNKKKRTCF